MPIDTSMYSTQSKPANPLDLIQGYAGAANAITQNKMLQQELKGRQAIGKIVARNTGENGVLNAPGFLKEVAQDPDASWLYLKNQEEAKNANPLTNFMTTNKAGQPIQAQAPFYQVAYPQNQGQQSANQGRQPANQLTGQSENEQLPWLQEQPNGSSPQPELSQEKIDKLHKHNRAIIDTLEPLANDPELDHKKAIRAVSDLVANPDVEFNAMDGASTLAAMPYGANGTPPSREELQERIAPMLEQQKQHEAVLKQRFPATPAAPIPPELAQQESPLELSTPGATATGLPTGYSSPQVKSRESYDQVTDEAETVPQRIYAYNEIINLANSGAESGTVFADIIKKAGRLPGWVLPEGTTDKAAQTQELSKFMSQALLGNGMPASDSRLQELQSGNLNPEQLVSTIKNLAPAFKAVAKGAVEKQKFYNRATHNGNDLSREPEAAQEWNANFDPRWIEYADQKNDKKTAFLKQHPDMLESMDKLSRLKKMGVIGKRE